ncbi:MAG: MmcQ/YjbR family DNA-binding protein [Oscillospiraceae bacterium]|nr:MmcQ/YjbR family DNA-binding protein [Oscillospiraceae bacterium]
MTLPEIEAYCLAKPGAYVDYPFNEFPVIKVKAPSQDKGSIFAMPFVLREQPVVTLKCDMMTGDHWRQLFPGTVTRGYHCPPVQQPYFNTVLLDGTVPSDMLLDMIDHAYAVVVAKLPKKYQKEII